MLVGLEEVLIKLRDKGPQPTHDIAYQFELNALDARMLMLHAHVSGLVNRNDWGEWAITERGRESISPGATAEAHRLGPRRPWWRPGWQAGAILATGAAACALVAGLAGGIGSSTGAQTAASSYAQTRSAVGGHRHKRVHAGRHKGQVTLTLERRYDRRVLISKVTRLRSKPVLLRSRPSLLLARVGQPAGSAKAGSSTTSVRVASVRRPASSAGSAHHHKRTTSTKPKKSP